MPQQTQKRYVMCMSSCPRPLLVDHSEIHYRVQKPSNCPCDGHGLDRSHPNGMDTDRLQSAPLHLHAAQALTATRRVACFRQVGCCRSKRQIFARVTFLSVSLFVSSVSRSGVRRA